MNPFFAPGKALHEPLEKVLMDLQLATVAHIVLATTDDATIRREVTAEVAEQLSGTYEFHEFDYTKTETLSLPRFCRTLSREGLPACVFATGLEDLTRQNPAQYQEALAFLNNHREDIVYTKTAVVLWLTTQTETDLFAQALDFVDWRTCTVTFALPNNWRMDTTTLGKLPLLEAEKLRHQARRFKEMLARPNLDLAMRAELLKQLAFAQQQLGQEAASKKALNESTHAAVQLGNTKELATLYRRYLIDRYGKLTFYSATADAPLAVDLERVFVTLSVMSKRVIVRPAPISLSLNEGVISSEPREPFPGSVSQVLAPERPEESSGVMSTSEALQSGDVLVAIGAPGSGKTTLLKYLALTFARDQAQERLGLKEKRLPIFVTLRDFNRFLDEQTLPTLDALVLPRFLSSHFREVAPHLNLVQAFFAYQLKQGKCIVLFDGLDEVADPVKRGRVAEALATCIRKYDNNRFVVTARPRGYEGEARKQLSRLAAECIIRDFDDVDRAAFARSWYEAVTRDRLGDTPVARAEAHRQAEDLLRTIHADARVQRLSHNPLLLSVLAMVHQRGVGLPQRRAELYDECTDLLLGYWDQTKGGEAARELATLGELSRSEKRALLEPIALWFHERGESGLEVDKTELEQQITRQFVETFGDNESKARNRAALFLRVIDERAGLLVERETGVYVFAHLTFQEYLAARAIADREDYIEYTLRHLHEPWWREVLLLEVGHLSDVRHFGRRARKLTSDLIRAIRQAGSKGENVAKRDLLFATRCVCDTGNLGVDEDLRRSLIDELLALWRAMPSGLRRQEVTEIFAYAMPTVGGERIPLELVCHLDGPDMAIWRVTVEALGRLGRAAVTPAVLERLLVSTENTDPAVRWNAVWALGRLGRVAAAPTVLQRLQVLTEDTDSAVRWNAVWALEQLGDLQNRRQKLADLWKQEFGNK